MTVGVYTSVSDCRESEEMGLTADHGEMGVVQNKEGQERECVSVCVYMHVCVCERDREMQQE